MNRRSREDPNRAKQNRRWRPTDHNAGDHKARNEQRQVHERAVAGLSPDAAAALAAGRQSDADRMRAIFAPRPETFTITDVETGATTDVVTARNTD